ncbi:biotin--[acetyl-CoA-carboxylase] ligase [Roseburia sp. 1XD42-34]|nr:biotin--[acetyl-CoA-carboxylase] ligase [Roseburia sp. 1XD42-34]NBJ71463.1 biotin--[acetyl-CoA-carboxylase] ligase [Roseburia sp. 1XD42-34]RKI74483.1 biotin--[acetyl-CoA-carboxylase] ligase [Clostridium sp. 1xD42-85]
MQSTRNQLIQLLAKNEEDYISGQALSEELNISRSAIWKHMKELEKDGYEIEAKSKRGYRIISYPEKISENTVRWGLETKWLGKNVIHREVTSSTQIIAHNAAKEHKGHGTIVIADEQISGRGRMNRDWHSKKGDGMWMSMVLQPSLPPYLAPQLTLLTAVALAETIEELTALMPSIKWPNDILFDNEKKCAGILTELQAEQDQIQYVIIGVGLNINQESKDWPVEVQQRATSLQIETGRQWSIKQIMQHFLKHFEILYDTYMQQGFLAVKTKWEAYGFKMGERITIRQLDRHRQAIFYGLADDGALLIKNEDGSVERLYSGEIDWFHKADANEA